MVEVIYEYVDTVFLGGGGLFLFYFNGLVGCFSMIVWTPAVLRVYASVLYFCICPCSAQFSMFHMEMRSRNMLIIIIIIINCFASCLVIKGYYAGLVCMFWW